MIVLRLIDARVHPDRVARRTRGGDARVAAQRGDEVGLEQSGKCRLLLCAGVARRINVVHGHRRPALARREFARSGSFLGCRLRGAVRVLQRELHFVGSGLRRSNTLPINVRRGVVERATQPYFPPAAGAADPFHVSRSPRPVGDIRCWPPRCGCRHQRSATRTPAKSGSAAPPVDRQRWWNPQPGRPMHPPQHKHSQQQSLLHGPPSLDISALPDLIYPPQAETWGN